MKLALGSVQFGVDYGISSISGQVDFFEVDKILNYAHQKGINLIDTAPAYGNSEKVLGELRAEEFSVVTKTRHLQGTSIGSNELNLVESDLGLSLLNLRRSSVYGLLVHDANDLLKKGAHKLVSLLHKLKQEGKVEKVGVSIYSGEQLSHILDCFDVDLVQLPFNILDRRLVENGMLEILRKKNIEVHARSVFLQGLLLMEKQSRPPKFGRWDPLWTVWHEWLYDHNMTALEASLRYSIQEQSISKVLVGVETLEQLKDIVVAAKGALPPVPAELSTRDVDLLNPSNWSAL